jgi:hypothetical protein
MPKDDSASGDRQRGKTASESERDLERGLRRGGDTEGADHARERAEVFEMNERQAGKDGTGFGFGASTGVGRDGKFPEHGLPFAPDDATGMDIAKGDIGLSGGGGLSL